MACGAMSLNGVSRRGFGELELHTKGRIEAEQLAPSGRRHYPDTG